MERITNPALWTTGATDPASYPELAGNQQWEVAVVGGGITGLTTALLLKERGVKVAVLEAAGIGSGTSGHSTGKVSVLHGLFLADLLGRAGEAATAGYAEAGQGAVEEVARLVGDYRIDCDFDRRPAFIYTAESDRVPAIKAEVDAARRAGLSAEFTSETELPFAVEGAIRLDGQVQIDPYRYCSRLAAAIHGDGCAVFENTRVFSVTEQDDGCELQTAYGTVRAGTAITATLLPFMDAGGFYRKTTPSRSYLLALRLEGPAPRGMYLSADTPTRTLRSTADGLLIAGGYHHPVGHGPDTRRFYGQAENWIREQFKVQEVVHRWSAQDYLPKDGVPYVGRASADSRHLLVATGLKKWGLGLGTSAAMILADLVTGRDNPWSGLFDATRPGYEDWPGAIEHGETEGAVSPPASPDELTPGAGAVFTRGEEKSAVYRDETGRLLAVDALCTHKGCELSFNTAERTWDCNCHGSRFRTDGEVIEGPAVHPLEQRESQ